MEGKKRTILILKAWMRCAIDRSSGWMELLAPSGQTQTQQYTESLPKIFSLVRFSLKTTFKDLETL